MRSMCSVASAAKKPFHARSSSGFSVASQAGSPRRPTPGDRCWRARTTTLIGSRRDALNGAAADAEARGYHVLRLDEPVVGDARTAAVSLARAALANAAGRAAADMHRRDGETTVKVVGHGKGGRNQEFALAAAGLLARRRNAGDAGQRRHRRHRRSDRRGGRHRRSHDHGARGRGRRLAPGQFLLDNNAYAFFDALGDLIHTGPTGTNVGDLQVILLA